MNNKTKYKKFCIDENLSIFSQYWWLDIVCQDNLWDVILYENGGIISATLPFSYKKKYNSLIITQPILTPTNGIFIKYPSNQKYTSKLSFEKKILTNIINQLENWNISYYCQSFPYEFTNWLPFYWKNYKQTTRYSYIIENTSDFDSLYKNISSSTKNLIKKAERIVEVKKDLSLIKFYEINSMTFNRKGLEIPYSFDLLEKIDYECKKRNCREILYTIDKDKNIHSVMYIIWDKSYMYYLLGGINPLFKSSNSQSLLIKEALILAGSKKLKFDFEGSMNKDIEHFFSSFGGKQTPYFTISKQFKFTFKNSINELLSTSPKLKKNIKSAINLIKLK